jgi:predicted molibdopterin-dependent oxidoreductase YjgC
MGALPNVFTAYQRVTDGQVRDKFETAWGVPLPDKNGLTVVEMLNAAHAGVIKGMWVIGENPAMSDPDASHVRAALEQLDFLVVQDLFMTETAQLADVVLPAASFAEKDGTFTNTERRVQRVRRAVDPPSEARPDWWIVAELAKRMLWKPEVPSAGWDYASPEDIFREMAALTPSYAGITYQRLEDGGLQWPVPNTDHPGTPILHREKFTRGLGLFSAVEYVPPAEQPDAEYPYILTTGRVLQQYHTGSMTHKVAGLDALAPEERVEVNSDDAARIGLRDRDWIRVSSRRGQLRARARVTPHIAPGVVFMTFHYAEALGNLLTNPALDPIAKIPEFKVCAVQVEPDGGQV